MSKFLPHMWNFNLRTQDPSQVLKPINSASDNIKIMPVDTRGFAELLTPEQLRHRRKIDLLQDELRAHAERQKRQVSEKQAKQRQDNAEKKQDADTIEDREEANVKIADLVLGVLDKLDTMVHEADERLIYAKSAETTVAGRPKGPRPLKGSIKPFKQESVLDGVPKEFQGMFGDMKVRAHRQQSTEQPIKAAKEPKRAVKLPPWRHMMEEKTPPGSPFSRKLIVEVVEKSVEKSAQLKENEQGKNMNQGTALMPSTPANGSTEEIKEKNHDSADAAFRKDMVQQQKAKERSYATRDLLPCYKLPTLEHSPHCELEEHVLIYNENTSRNEEKVYPDALKRGPPKLGSDASPSTPTKRHSDSKLAIGPMTTLYEDSEEEGNKNHVTDSKLNVKPQIEISISYRSSTSSILSESSNVGPTASESSFQYMGSSETLLTTSVSERGGSSESTDDEYGIQTPRKADKTEHERRGKSSNVQPPHTPQKHTPHMSPYGRQFCPTFSSASSLRNSPYRYTSSDNTPVTPIKKRLDEIDKPYTPGGALLKLARARAASKDKEFNPQEVMEKIISESPGSNLMKYRSDLGSPNHIFADTPISQSTPLQVVRWPQSMPYSTPVYAGKYLQVHSPASEQNNGDDDESVYSRPSEFGSEVKANRILGLVNADNESPLLKRRQRSGSFKNPFSDFQPSPAQSPHGSTNSSMKGRTPKELRLLGLQVEDLFKLDDCRELALKYHMKAVEDGTAGNDPEYDPNWKSEIWGQRSGRGHGHGQTARVSRNDAPTPPASYPVPSAGSKSELNSKESTPTRPALSNVFSTPNLQRMGSSPAGISGHTPSKRSTKSSSSLKPEHETIATDHGARAPELQQPPPAPDPDPLRATPKRENSVTSSGLNRFQKMFAGLSKSSSTGSSHSPKRGRAAPTMHPSYDWGSAEKEKVKSRSPSRLGLFRGRIGETSSLGAPDGELSSRPPTMASISVEGCTALQMPPPKRPVSSRGPGGSKVLTEPPRLPDLIRPVSPIRLTRVGSFSTTSSVSTVAATPQRASSIPVPTQQQSKERMSPVRSVSDSDVVPAIVLIPPSHLVSKPPSPYRHSTFLSELPLPHAPLQLSRPSSGLGSRPQSRLGAIGRLQGVGDKKMMADQKPENWEPPPKMRPLQPELENESRKDIDSSSDGGPEELRHGFQVPPARGSRSSSKPSYTRSNVTLTGSPRPLSRAGGIKGIVGMPAYGRTLPGKTPLSSPITSSPTKKQLLSSAMRSPSRASSRASSRAGAGSKASVRAGAGSRASLSSRSGSGNVNGKRSKSRAEDVRRGVRGAVTPQQSAAATAGKARKGTVGEAAVALQGPVAGLRRSPAKMLRA
ncbi:hypothetical protein BDZ91DRAFT_793972 [Kalaharituber pfeilii]|nr:hypothetical protein BDZ91DRAFT_793972 [Kalaharituber pfeilii]